MNRATSLAMLWFFASGGVTAKAAGVSFTTTTHQETQQAFIDLKQSDPNGVKIREI